MGQRSPYPILGIPVRATHREIRKAYRRLAMKYHPDRNRKDPDAEEKFKEVQRAYELLSEGRRTKGSLQAAQPYGFDDSFSDLSHPFFSFYMATRKYFSKDQAKQPRSRKKGERGNKR